MNIFVVNEAQKGRQFSTEKRCALTPASAKKLIRLGYTVTLETNAGKAAGFSDSDFTEVDVNVTKDRENALQKADILLYVNRPMPEEVSQIKANAIVIGHCDPFFNQSLIENMAKAKLNTLSIEMIPRSTRAQKMDALSSQASLAGYVMVMQAANALPSILPMMMTPSGTIKPAKVFIICAGVSGLQAIATAKRLGANVLAYDTRPVVDEQVQSLGGKFLHIDIGETGQTKDGYAKELTDEQKQIQQDAQRDAIADSDIVITTAQLFGRKPPVLISKETLGLMRPGSVVVDMAAQSGGNVEGSVSGKTKIISGVTVIGNGNWSQAVARDATEMYANNLANLIDEFTDSETQSFNLDLDDEKLAQSVIKHDGAVINDMLVNAFKGAK